MTTIKIKRGVEANRLSTTPETGEPIVALDTSILYIGDDLTPGGKPLKINHGDVNGLGQMALLNKATEAQAEAGTSDTVGMTALRTSQAFAAWWSSSPTKTTIDSLKGMAFLDKATQAQAIAGESDVLGMTPLLTRTASAEYGYMNGPSVRSSLVTIPANEVTESRRFRMSPEDENGIGVAATVDYIHHSNSNAVQHAFAYSGPNRGSYRRLLSGTTWDPNWVRYWDSENLLQSSIDNWNTAYGWGNHASANYTPNTRTITAGTGLSGGGNLTANRTLSVSFGTAAGTVAQGNDSRIINGQTAHGWGNHASAGYLTSVTWDDVSSKPAQATRWPTFAEVTSKPATYAPITGTTAGTAAAGNDSRINNGQTAYGWGNHASAGYLTSVAWGSVGGKPSTFPPTIGTTASTAKAGNWVPSWGDVTGKPAVIAAGTTQAAARDAIEAAKSPSMVAVFSSRTLATADLERILAVQGSGDKTITLPDLGVTGVPIVVHALNARAILVPGAGMTLRASMGGTPLTGTRTVDLYSAVTLYQTSDTYWEVFGSGIS